MVAALPTLAASPALAQGKRTTTAINPNRVVYSVALADQIFAYLRYLPVAFVAARPPVRPVPTTTTTSTSTTTTTVPSSTSTTPATSTTTSTSTSTSTTTTRPPAPRRAPAVSYVTPQKGHYAWRFANLPASLKSQWQVGGITPIFRGAVMRFQAQHNLPVTGGMDTPTWVALVTAGIKHQFSNETYNWVLVSQTQPERLWLYRNGVMSMTTLVNTGITASPTENGTFVVYLRYKVTTMSGILPNGKPYHDTGIPWTSYFNGGDALHGFIRSTYGWPQSLGCVEMPFVEAGALWPYTPLGTLVTVEP